MEDKERKTRKRRKLTISTVLLLLLFVCISVFAIYRLHLKWKLNSRIEAIRAAGYPVTCAELDAWYTIPDNAENAAHTILDAFSFYQEWDKDELNALPLVGQAKLPARTEPLTDEMKTLISEYIADNNEAIDLLHAGAKIEYCRYPVDYSAGFATLLPSLADIRRGCQMLNLEALLYAENGDTDSAMSSVQSGFGLAHSLAKEPSLVCQLVRLAGDALTVSAIERIVNRGELTDAQLTELSERLRNVEFASDMFPAFVGERCMGLKFFKEPMSLGPEFHPGVPMRPILALCQAAGLVDMDAAIYLEAMDDYMEALRLPYQERRKAVDLVDTRFASMSKIHIFAHEFMPALARIITIELRAIAHLRVARSGLAIQRYRLATGAIPDTLSELVPAYLDAVPKDPFDGNELRYKKRETGFIIYSIGEDLSDDDGTERPEKRRGKDDPKWDVTFILER
ncbi:MAG: hypothetical protein JXM79_01730 [Sedimentisphaerales bacterium]|nr:hypothetical protein [Sedimentisphaerales bacterium]